MGELRIFPALSPASESSKSLLTTATFLNIGSHDNSGRILHLYCFYAMKAADRDEGQPYCNDEWTATQLSWDVKTVRKARKKLMEANVIRVIRKGRKRYIQVQYLPFIVSNKKHRSLSIENIPPSVMSTTGVFDYYAKWYDTIQGNPNRFVNTVCKQTGQRILEGTILKYLKGTYDKICRTGYGIEKVNNELSFFLYLVSSVINKVKSYEND